MGAPSLPHRPSALQGLNPPAKKKYTQTSTVKTM